MLNRHFRYLFGPVASRRFGRSLGVDLLGRRVCSFDCVFCEAGPTQQCTYRRDHYVPVNVVMGELRAWFGAGGEADVVTLAGLGEPTLHLRFGEVIDAVHDMSRLPVVLLSNGSLLWMPEVRADAARADIVKVSLSGWDDASVAQVNHPAQGLSFSSYLEGMIAFRKMFQGELRLEVMFVAGLNDSDASAAELARLAALIAPDKIELNTVVRPPARSHSGAVSREKLAGFLPLFGAGARVIGAGVLANLQAAPGIKGDLDPSVQILALLSRRGCTVDEIALAIGRPVAFTQRFVDEMVRKGGVTAGTGQHPHYQLVKEPAHLLPIDKKKS
jgi:wyosine [tRNA(Phe)-imidazoG37] synthetase (radical SAM superfamily)